jgi:hypothetical protein
MVADVISQVVSVREWAGVNCFDLIFCLVSWLKSIENNGLLVSTGSLASPITSEKLWYAEAFTINDLYGKLIFLKISIVKVKS